MKRKKFKILKLIFIILFIILWKIFLLYEYVSKRNIKKKSDIIKNFKLDNNNKIYNNNFNNSNKIIKTLRKNYYIFMNEYKTFMLELPFYNHTHLYNKTIFWCWLQGIKNIPYLSRACLFSLIRNCKNYHIIIITEKNMNNYIHFPQYILYKYKKKYISRTHFSDLLRLELLIKYGGTWIDSTVLITKYNKTFFLNDLFFFQNIKSKKFSGSNWFLTSEKKSPILRTTLDLLYEYWRKNNYICHYFLFHFFFFGISSEKYLEDFKKVLKVSNEPVHELQLKLFSNFTKVIYIKIINSISIHKLTHKRKPKSSKGLFYHHILQEYESKNKINPIVISTKNSIF